jgi:hypothetical protein
MHFLTRACPRERYKINNARSTTGTSMIMGSPMMSSLFALADDVELFELVDCTDDAEFVCVTIADETDRPTLVTSMRETTQMM